MSAPLRVAGWGTLDDGASITWTIADGRRGRRWREVVTGSGAVAHSLLLETGPDRRFSHLELARVGGLWTFHPESDGTLHGNHVDPRERDVHHVTGLPFGPDDVLIVEGSPLDAAAVAWRLSSGMVVGSSATVAGVILRQTGSIEATRAVSVERLSPTRWRIGDGRAFDIDADGLPHVAEGQRRPLEIG
jgi:hypothetical protein